MLCLSPRNTDLLCLLPSFINFAVVVISYALACYILLIPVVVLLGSIFICRLYLQVFLQQRSPCFNGSIGIL